MASCFFLLRQFDDVLVYLKSVKAYFDADDDFNWNFGLAKAQAGDWKEAEEALLKVQNERYRGEYAYVAHLARCHIMGGRARAAWELYLRMETSDESFQLLQLIATDCYRTGAFYYAAKAFDVLERLDPNPEYWEGKRGACVGVFQLIVAGEGGMRGREEKREMGLGRRRLPVSGRPREGADSHSLPPFPSAHRQGAPQLPARRAADAAGHQQPAGGAGAQGHPEVGQGQRSKDLGAVLALHVLISIMTSIMTSIM